MTCVIVLVNDELSEYDETSTDDHVHKMLAPQWRVISKISS